MPVIAEQAGLLLRISSAMMLNRTEIFQSGDPAGFLL